MKKYKLKKDLPTFSAGDIFTLADNGNLYKDIGEQIPIHAYAASTLAKFPNILSDWFEEILDQPKTVWDLKIGDSVWYVDGEHITYEANWDDAEMDRNDREYGDVFLTKEEAEQELARRKAKQILLRDTKGFRADWKHSDEWKYYVDYTIMAHELITCLELNHLSHEIYFATEEDAVASIKAHEKEWKIYLGVEE